jgi:chromosome segregation ATPase
MVDRKHRHTDDEDVEMRFGQKVSIAIILVLATQAGSSIWWASGVSKSLDDHDKHLSVIDDINKKNSDAYQQVSERLTRVEEQQKSAQQSLNRIEDKLTAVPAAHGR